MTKLVLFCWAGACVLLIESIWANDVVGLSCGMHPLQIGQLVRLKTISPDSAIVIDTLIGFTEQKLYLGQRGSQTITRIFTQSGEVQEFCGIGAQFDSDSRMLTGETIKGDTVNISMANIDHIEAVIDLKGKRVAVSFDTQEIERRLKFDVRHTRVDQVIPVDSVKTLEIMKNSREKTAMVIALPVGFAVGLIVWVSVYENASENRNTNSFSIAALDKTGSFFEGLGAGMLAGGAVGGILYFAIKGNDHWEQVPIEKLNIKVAPVSDGLGVAFSVKF